MKNPFKQFIKFLISLIIVIGIYYVGYAVGHKNLVWENNYQPKVLGVSTDKPKDIDFSLFWDAWDILKGKYIGVLDTQKMVYGAISGLVESSGDPYTMFMDPDDAKRFSEDLQGSFDGIGAELENKNGLLVVVAPLQDSPAEKVGLKANDIILKIDGEDVEKMTFPSAIAKIRGEKGTKVKLGILRPENRKELELEVTRNTIVVKSVKWEEKQGNLYIKISQFGDDTTDLMKQAAQYSIDKNYPGIILDLRNNPGGYLESAIDISSLFLDNEKTVVTEQNKQGEKKIFKTTLTPILKNKKLAILVNNGSASASEILSGAMQDDNRATLVGEKTFGKGSVQSLEKLKDGSEIKVTIAKWLTPTGKAIDGEGIKPDIEVKLTDDDLKNNRDPQLDKALELIK